MWASPEASDKKGGNRSRRRPTYRLKQNFVVEFFCE
jgi:hypothetical protein